MEDLTESWGYLPVQTPVFDYYDNYRPLLDKRLEEQTYKLIDRGRGTYDAALGYNTVSGQTDGNDPFRR